ncbi:ATP-binding protein [Nocardioides marmoriginsengisoli]|uniref:ATP-binding protein n=1 Tax=Nocardioides marmoriginsengisoli TaxID=661483 RepID=A0A3N0CQ37_9ACTN|nr:ATP-binding protein [Nocardioides marmoriginsengisoli]RNL65449.1 ATP-binding protein [Nocardioides marmoriginsengisoli]
MTPSVPPPSAGVAAPPKAYRNTEEGLVGGVAAGLAEHLRLPVMWVRAAFIAASVMGGFGLMFYAGLWMLLPVQAHFDDTAPGLAAAERQGKRPRRKLRLVDYGPLIAIATIGIGTALLLAMVTGRGGIFWPLLLAVGGVAVLWRQADEAQRERWVDSSGRINVVRAIVGGGGAASYLRLVAGVVMLVSAITLFSFGGGGWGAARDVGIASTLGILGLAFIAGPWLMRLTSDLSEERAERVRSQERADVAAHLHDSVLQTLALIQKSAHDPAAVARLARSQERDLRSWLFDSSGADATTLAVALRTLAGEVDDMYGVSVEVVCVGDPPVTEGLRALVLATREAVVNAARHSGAAKVDVYAEAGAEMIEIFVRDRGAGFDPDAVAADRHGLRDSIVERMRRHGGAAEVRSTPGTGTEIRLSQPTGEST